MSFNEKYDMNLIYPSNDDVIFNIMKFYNENFISTIENELDETNENNKEIKKENLELHNNNNNYNENINFPYSLYRIRNNSDPEDFYL